MTEYELLNLIATSKMSVALAVLSLLALLSAYLAVAHFAGRKLPRPHAFTLTSLMLWFSFLIITAMHTSFGSLIDLQELGGFAYTAIRRTIVFKWLATLGCSLAPILCIKFMYEARHPILIRGPTEFSPRSGSLAHNDQEQGPPGR